MEHRAPHPALPVGAGGRHLSAADGAAHGAGARGPTITEWLRDDLLGKAGLSGETEQAPALTTPRPSATAGG